MKTGLLNVSKGMFQGLRDRKACLAPSNRAVGVQRASSFELLEVIGPIQATVSSKGPQAVNICDPYKGSDKLVMILVAVSGATVSHAWRCIQPSRYVRCGLVWLCMALGEMCLCSGEVSRP